MSLMDEYDVIVVGGGAAGLMAAGVCAGRGRKTLLVEKNNQMGRKLRITGKGRCNVTNNCSVSEVIAAAPRGGKFLYGAISAFPPESTMAFFESLGVPLKTERGRRVFPVSDKAEDVACALESFAKKNGAKLTRGRVVSLIEDKGEIRGIVTESGKIMGKSVLLACGGASYPGTGSNGEGYELAKKAGHSLTPIAPSLVPLVEMGDYCSRLMGLSLRNCGVRVMEKGKKKPVYEDFGELLFTHFGLSGPTVLSATAHMHPMEQGRYTVQIDLKPGLDEAQLNARILRDFEKYKNKNFANSLNDLLPHKLIPVIVERSGIPGDIPCNSVTREQRRTLCGLLKCFDIRIKGFRPIAEAIITSGGVSLKEIDPRTMESKLVKGLYFAGEILDCDAYTGGYNLQIAFSTGRLAGISMGNLGEGE